jgi:hypothetical protein
MSDIWNPYCMRCSGTEGGPYGHETNECRKGREAEMDRREASPSFFRKA